MFRSLKRTANDIQSEASSGAADLLAAIEDAASPTSRQVLGEVRQAYEDTLAHTLDLVRKNPFGVVVAVGAIAFAVGALWVTTSRRR